MKQIAFLMLLLIGRSIHAQTAKEDLVKMNHLYRDAKSYAMNISVKLYQQEKAASPSVTYKGSSKMSKGQYHVDMMGRLTILNDRVFMVVDRNQKMILVRSASPEQRQAMQALQQTVNIDSLMQADKSEVSYLVNSATEKRILIRNAESGYKRIELKLDPRALTLLQIVMVPEVEGKEEGQLGKLIVDYTEVQLNKAIEGSSFSEAAYLSQKGKDFYATPAYKNYQVINQDKVVIE